MVYQKNQSASNVLRDQLCWNFPYQSSNLTCDSNHLQFLNAPFFARAQGRCGMI